MSKNEIVKLRVMQVDNRDVPAKYIEAFNSYLDKVVIPHFEQQLAEKDKEIEKLRKEATEEIEFLHKQYDRCDRARKKAVKQLKDQRHQICEKIREKAFPHYYLGKVTGYIIDMELLDQIEKGE